MPILTRHFALGPDVDPPEPTLSELFHENTKYQPGAPVGGLIPTTYSDAETAAMVSVGRSYARALRVALPPPASARQPSPSFDEVIRARRNCRSFGRAPITLETLSSLLFSTNGVTGRALTQGGFARELRATPSAGAVYPIEVYLGVRRVEGLPAGIYHFDPRAHEVARLSSRDETPALIAACHYRASAEQAALIVVFAGVFPRTKRKYGERGYRYVLIEAGHAAQNLGLASVALGLGCMNVCGFWDDALNDVLQLDGVDDAALYVAYVGSHEAPDARS